MIKDFTRVVSVLMLMFGIGAFEALAQDDCSSPPPANAFWSACLEVGRRSNIGFNNLALNGFFYDPQIGSLSPDNFNAGVHTTTPLGNTRIWIAGLVLLDTGYLQIVFSGPTTEVRGFLHIGAGGTRFSMAAADYYPDLNELLVTYEWSDPGLTWTVGDRILVALVPETAPPPPAEVVVKSLRARFRDVPTEHDGTTAFALQIAFNEPIEMTEEKMKQALTVTGGTVTSALQVDDRNDLWEITVTPNSNANVHISLPRTTSCVADGAVCTFDRRMLSRGVAASVARAPLRGHFENVPAGHDGSTAFTLQLAFSEPIETTEEEMQQKLTATGGTVTSAQKVDDRNDLWEITARPNSNDDVSISLPPTTSCVADDAVCTVDGRMLSAGVAVSVPRVPLTVRLENVPAGHHGSTAFAVDLVFSEPIGLTASALKQALTVTGGRMIGPRRVGGLSDRWEITIHPNATDVSIALLSTASCDADGAVCTKDGLALRNDAQAVIPFAGYLMPHSLDKVSGDNQEGPASTQLTEPFVVLASDEDGVAMAGVIVTFSVTAGGGLLSSNTDANPCTFELSKSSITAITDANGQATKRLTLGSEPGTNTVAVSVEALEPEPFTATATEQVMSHTLEKVCGEDQAGTAGTLLAQPLVVLVSDEDGAAIAGVDVSFAVTAGGGMLSATTPTTNSDGLARTWLTLGSELGTNTVTGTVEGLAPVTFTASGEDPFARFADFFGSGKRTALPDQTQLLQNAPNPFNSQTVLSYFLLEPGPARLEVFALTGQRVAVLHQGSQQAGYHRLHWDGRDAAGHPVASGAYLYRLVTDEAVLTRKLILLR